MSLPYVIILILIGAAIYQQFVIRKYMRLIDNLKLDLIKEAKKVYENQTELAKLKGADEIRGKSIKDQAAYIADLMDEL